MILETADVAAIRMAESRGWFATEAELAAIGLTQAGYVERLQRLSASGLIRSFKATLVVPPLVGGDGWVWAAMVAQSKRALGVASALSTRLPFVTDIILNTSLPEGVGPNLALLFYSRDFESETQFVRGTAGLDYHEVYRIAEYSFPVALPLSTEERSLVRFIVEHPNARAVTVGAALERPLAWVQAKLDRLLWSDANRSGVLRIQPEVNWALADNFGHFHFLVETGHQPDQLARQVEGEGLSLVFGGRPFQGRYVQIEADVWGIGQLLDASVFLNQIPGVRVAGVLWNRDIMVNDRWVASLL
jgi:hypothetical protein